MAKKQKIIDISAKNHTKTFGWKLRSARKDKNLSIADLHNLTKIPVQSIENLENEAWDKLPASVYVSGFIKSYAKQVNLDYNELLDLYKKSAPDKQPKEFPGSDIVHIKAAMNNASNEKRENKNNESRVSTALVVFILIILASLAVSYFSNQKETDSASSPSASEITNMDVTG